MASAMPDPALRVLYRAAPGGNRKTRPPWFSKWVCLGSFLRAVDELPDGAVDLTFMCDGPLDPVVVAAMNRYGKVEVLNRLGNSKSYLHAVQSVTEATLPDESGVYLVEDDYLHLPDALSGLSAVLAEASAGTYLTLYDHPDRYTRTDDLPPRGRGVELLGGRHWRRVESTNMTFATTVGTLRRDRRMHWASARFTGYPHDRALWRTVQGLGWRRPARWAFGRRVLLGALPALATHCDDGMLAPTIDWHEVATATKQWMAAHGLDEAVDW
ncbi:MAG: hypothetical protein M3163_14055 [Actinomycetota bacterium]|nr:hypothetical protein [Actinomycetota bacterium]